MRILKTRGIRMEFRNGLDDILRGFLILLKTYLFAKLSFWQISWYWNTQTPLNVPLNFFIWGNTLFSRHPINTFSLSALMYHYYFWLCSLFANPTTAYVIRICKKLLNICKWAYFFQTKKNELCEHTNPQSIPWVFVWSWNSFEEHLTTNAWISRISFNTVSDVCVCMSHFANERESTNLTIQRTE